MSCVPTDRLLQTIKVEVPGVTDAMISLQLFNAMDEFFRRTSAWKFRQDIDLEEGSLEYGLALPAGSTLVRIMGVMHNGVPVAPVSSAGAGRTSSSLGELVPESFYPDGDSSFAPQASDLESNIFTYAIYRPEYITVTAPPDAERVKHPLVLLATLSVAHSCLECDDCGDWGVDEWMWDMFFQDWLNGTLGRLYGMPSKPWTSEKLAVYHGKRFRQSMAFRKQEAPRGFAHAVPGWRYPRVGGWI